MPVYMDDYCGVVDIDMIRLSNIAIKMVNDVNDSKNNVAEKGE